MLVSKGASFDEISLTSMPEWRQFMFLLTNGIVKLSGNMKEREKYLDPIGINSLVYH